MTINDELTPKENLLVFHLIYKIEVGLREYIIRALGANNPLWWKQRLPSDVLEKYRVSG